MNDPLPRTHTSYHVAHRIAGNGGWVRLPHPAHREVGWAVSEMNRCADLEPHLDWRVASGGGINGANGPVVVHRLRRAGTPGPDRTAPATEAPRRMTVEQTWKRLPAIPEDDPL
jgi:hypothetical protein